MKTSTFISLTIFLFLLGVPFHNFAGNCATELIFQSVPVSSTVQAKKSKPSFKEKVATWVIKRKLITAGQKKYGKKHQKSKKGKLKRNAYMSLIFGVLSIIFPLLSFPVIILAIVTIKDLDKENGTQKLKDAAWMGLLFAIIGLGRGILRSDILFLFGGG